MRPKVDILVASCHWGLGREPLQYMTEIGRAAIDAGANVVVCHGPHYSLPVELYKGRPIYYGLGNLCFKTGHLGRRHENWIGIVAEVSFASFESMRANAHACRAVAPVEAVTVRWPRKPEEAPAGAPIAVTSATPAVATAATTATSAPSTPAAGTGLTESRRSTSFSR